MDCICQPDSIKERNGHQASCNRYNRKLETDSQKAEQKKAAKPKRIDKVGTKNTFKCSDGMNVTQHDINDLRHQMYEVLSRSSSAFCKGCGDWAQGWAHIVPQSRCKKLGKTELIWSPENVFEACHSCNSIAENVSSSGITKLNNFQRIKAVLELHDPERFAKLCYTENEPQ